jgi:hypothetical protein
MFTIVSQMQQQQMGADGVGRGVGSLALNAQDLVNNSIEWDPGLRRPYHENGQIWVDVTKAWAPLKDRDGQRILNARGEEHMVRVTEPELMIDRLRRGDPVLQVDNATVLPKEAWIRLDATVMESVRARLRAYSDLRASSTYGGFDAMAYPMLERELITDPGQAVVDMDGISEVAQNFQPHYALQGMPLPLTWCDFHMSERFLVVSRQAGRPADNQRGAIAGRRVGETIEKTTIGTQAGLTYGVAAAGSYLQTSKVYGYITHPARITYTSLTASATISAAIATTGGTTS